MVDINLCRREQRRQRLTQHLVALLLSQLRAAPEQGQGRRSVPHARRRLGKVDTACVAGHDQVLAVPCKRGSECMCPLH
eukprot:g65198.t1